MGKLPKPQQQFLLLFTGTALGSVVGYLMLREHFAQMDIDEFIQWSDTRKA